MTTRLDYYIRVIEPSLDPTPRWNRPFLGRLTLLEIFQDGTSKLLTSPWNATVSQSGSHQRVGTKSGFWFWTYPVVVRCYFQEHTPPPPPVPRGGGVVVCQIHEKQFPPPYRRRLVLQVIAVMLNSCRLKETVC